MRVKANGSEYRCTDCGNPRVSRRCGCLGASKDTRQTPNILVPDEMYSESVQWLTRARLLREAAKISPEHAAANLADAERLERWAIQGRA